MTIRDDVLAALQHTDMTSADLARWLRKSTGQISVSTSQLLDAGLIHKKERYGKWCLGAGPKLAEKDRLPKEPIRPITVEEHGTSRIVRFGHGWKAAPAIRERASTSQSPLNEAFL